MDEDALCPFCGEVMLSETCSVVGCEDGWIDMYEYDDAINFSPGEYELCEECHGWGVIVWCPSCGYELTRVPEGEAVDEW